MRLYLVVGIIALAAFALFVPNAAANPTCDFDGNCAVVIDEENGGVCLNRDSNGWCRGGYVATGVPLPIGPECQPVPVPEP